jgi:hypothetical protein
MAIRTPMCVLSAAALFVWLLPAICRAHCDTIDGPVVATARQALSDGDVTSVLRWVTPQGETEIRSAFAQAIKVRKLGAEAQALADTWFFETLVRVHRAGEGEPYTGLKPAGTPIEPAVAAADAAVASGSVDELAEHVAAQAEHGIRQRLAAVLSVKPHMSDSIDAGRAYVAAYVQFVHYVEQLSELAQADVHGHAPAHATPVHE